MLTEKNTLALLELASTDENWKWPLKRRGSGKLEKTKRFEKSVYCTRFSPVLLNTSFSSQNIYKNMLIITATVVAAVVRVPAVLHPSLLQHQRLRYFFSKSKEPSLHCDWRTQSFTKCHEFSAFPQTVLCPLETFLMSSFLWRRPSLAFDEIKVFVFFVWIVIGHRNTSRLPSRVVGRVHSLSQTQILLSFLLLVVNHSWRTMSGWRRSLPRKHLMASTATAARRRRRKKRRNIPTVRKGDNRKNERERVTGKGFYANESTAEFMEVNSDSLGR